MVENGKSAGRGYFGSEALGNFLNSKYMLVFLAALTLVSSLGSTFVEGFQGELIVYTVIALIGMISCLFSRDLLVWAPCIMLMYVSPSRANNPFFFRSSIFYPENGFPFWYIIGLVCLVFLCLLLRIFVLDKGKTFFKSKRELFIGLVIWCITMALGGIGYAEFDKAGWGYVAMLSSALLFPYVVLTGMVDWKRVKKDYFAYAGMLLGIVVAAQLWNAYRLDFHKIIADGVLFRNEIYCGWGSYTSMGGVLLFCLPCAFYLAAVKKCGFIYNVIGQITMLALALTFCRGAILCGGLTYIAYAVYLLSRKKNRIQNLVVYGLVFVILLGGVIFLCVNYWEKVKLFFSFFMKAGTSGRWTLYKEGLNRFMSNPVFGQGFYACSAYYNNPAGAEFLPSFMHNTFLQMMSACGILGLAGYLIHRIQTVVVFFKQPSLHKAFIAFTIGGVLLNCMLDCHIFNLGMTLFYSITFAFMEKAGEMCD